MDLIIYPRLGTTAKRAIVRRKKRYGRDYEYRPRITLVNRLVEELGWSQEQVLDQISAERRYLLSRFSPDL